MILDKISGKPRISGKTTIKQWGDSTVLLIPRDCVLHIMFTFRQFLTEENGRWTIKPTEVDYIMERGKITFRPAAIIQNINNKEVIDSEE